MPQRVEPPTRECLSVPDVREELVATGPTLTTVILHGLSPRQRSQDYFPIFEALGFDLSSDFDFIYMPMRRDKGRISSKGYMFINTSTPAVAAAFSRAIYHHPLFRDAARCEKVYCEPAVTQGLAANLAAMQQLPRQHVEFLVRRGARWMVERRTSECANSVVHASDDSTAPSEGALSDADLIREVTAATERFFAGVPLVDAGNAGVDRKMQWR